MIQVPAVWLALGALGKSLHYFLAKPMRLLSMIYFSIVIKINIVWISSLALLLAFFAAMVAIYWWRKIARNHDRDSLYSRLTYFCLNGWHLYVYCWFPSRRINWYDSRYRNDFGTIVLLVRVVYHLGGVESAVNKLTEIDPRLSKPLRPKWDAWFSIYGIILDLSLFWCGWFTAYRSPLHGFQR